MKNYGKATEMLVGRVVKAAKDHGHRSIIALAGVPGTGKSFAASIAAQRLATKIEMVREVQFHQSFSYEEFIEGLRLKGDGSARPEPGVFLEMNSLARDDEKNTYVLLIEELTRANIAAVLGEVLTYLEYREERQFRPVYSRTPTTIAKNLIILATFNPTDRSAIEVDSALLRRLRIVRCLPDKEQLAEMLGGRGLSAKVVAALGGIFDACGKQAGYPGNMPFGHGIFAEITKEEDLHDLWVERIEHLLRPPVLPPHQLTPIIEGAFPWRDSAFRLA